MTSAVKIWALFLWLTTLASCVIYINESHYETLSESEKLHFHKYSFQKASQDYINDTLIILELCPGDVKNYTEQHRFTWVSVWAPYCKSDYSSALPSLLTQAKEKYSEEGLGVMLISNSYAFQDISKSIEESHGRIVYVLDNDCYGPKKGKALKQFAAEMDSKHMFQKNEYYSEYFFFDTVLVRAAWQFSLAEIDSMIHESGRLSKDIAP